MQARQCPPADVLETLALGGAAGPEVQAHLAACDACQAALQRIREDNRFLGRFLVASGRATREAATPTAIIEIPGYQILGEIHRGGQGVVYRAVQRSTRREVAIKVMKHGPLATLSDRARFDREIETLGKLNHPNIVTVHDAGVVAGFQYFVMNYIDGRPLDEALRPAEGGGVAGAEPGRHEVRDPQVAEGTARVLELFIKVCDAVQAAHLRGIIHRDLKPSNIRVDQRGEPHVLDFGLAKSTGAEPDSVMTRTGQFVGSLPWASPEQVEGESLKIDLRTDVYSLGAILFQLLTGNLPFDVGSNLRQAVDTILFRDPPRPSARAAAAGGRPIDDDLDTIVLKCLAKDRERRYQTAGELARDLRRYLRGEAIEAKRDSAMYMLRKTLRRYRLHVVVVAAFVLLLTVFGAVMAVLYQRSEGLKHAAVQAAGSLDALLSQSNVEQGRMAGMLGNMDQAEHLLWDELLVHRAMSRPHAVHLNQPPGPPEAYWGLWELYYRFPCRRTLVPEPPATRTATVAADGSGIWTVDARGFVQKYDRQGACVDSYSVALPASRNMPAVNASGVLVVQFDQGRHAVWRRGGGAPLLALPAGAESVCSSLSGRRLAAVVDGEAIVWETDPVRELARFSGADGPLRAVALSTDERRLAARDRLGGIYVWEIETMARVAHAPPAAPRTVVHELGDLLFSPDDRRLADAWMETAGRVWNLDEDPPTAVELAERPGDYRVQSFSPDGQLLAVGDLRGAVRIFETATGQCRSAFVAHRGRVRGVGFTSDGCNLWTCGEEDLRLWEVTAGAGVRSVRVEGEAFHGVDVAPSGGWLCAGGAGGVLQRVAGDTLVVSRVDSGNTATISSTVISPDGRRLAAGTHGGAVLVWEEPEPRGTPLRLEHPKAVGHVRFSPDGERLATACDDGVVRIWRAADGRLERELPRAEDRVPQVAFDPAGRRLAVAVRSGSLRVWDFDAEQYETWSPVTQSPLRAVCFSPDGRWLMSAGAKRTVEIWDVARRAVAAALVGHTQEVFCLDVSAAGDLMASGDAGGAVRLWHVGRQRPLAVLEGHGGSVMALRFSPDGRMLVSAALDGTLRVWDLSYYAQHIAGNLEAQLRRLGAAASDSRGVAAWRAWAAEVRSAR